MKKVWLAIAYMKDEETFALCSFDFDKNTAKLKAEKEIPNATNICCIDITGPDVKTNLTYWLAELDIIGVDAQIFIRQLALNLVTILKEAGKANVNDNTKCP